MNTRAFYISIKLKLVATGAIIVFLFGCAVFDQNFRMLGLPSIIAIIAFIIILAFWDIKYPKKPLFVISEKDIHIYNHAVVQIDQIEHIKTVGSYNLELVLKDTLPVPLALWQLSKRDRKELSAMIENLIAEKRQNA